MRHLWVPVARVEDVRREGVVRARILDTELVVYGVDGVITVADAACPHRGAALWEGRVEDGALECPYHGWLFAPETGHCTLIPSLPPRTRLPAVSLRTHPALELYGHVWTSLDEPYLPPPEINGYSPETWDLACGNPADLSCGMRQLTENFRDTAHFPFVHQKSMGPDVQRVVPPYEVERRDWQLSWSLTTDLGGTALDGHGDLANDQTITYSLAMPMTASALTVFPDGSRRLVAQFAVPIATDGLTVRQFWVVGVEKDATHGVSLPEMWEYERLIFEEDFHIVENQHPKEAPLTGNTQAHTRADRYSLAYRRAYVDMLEQFADDHDNKGLM
nr:MULTISPECIES: Rieske 2Fe-2S domain-containing protein [unclassified Streptomyces]